MSNFDKFKQKLIDTYSEKKEVDNLYIAMEDFFDLKKNPLDLELVEDLDEVEYDSYGSEDSTLKRIFYSKEFDIFVEFLGTRCSYEGEEWKEMKEVKKIIKTIEVYE